MPFRSFHSSNLLYIAICAASIAAFALVGIYPNMRLIHQLDEDIEDLNAQAKTQEILFPVFKDLLKEAQQSVPDNLPLPDKRQMANNNLSSINTIFNQIALDNKVEFKNATPDARSYLEESGFLTMNVSFGGDFFDFRNLLFSICRLPYLESIDQLRIETIGDKKVITLKLQLSQK